MDDARLEHCWHCSFNCCCRVCAVGGAGRVRIRQLIEIGASTVVIWELSGSSEARQRVGLRLIGCAFIKLAFYITVQSVVVLGTGYHAKHSPLGIAWTAITAAVMFALAGGKSRSGRVLNNPVLLTEGRVTLLNGLLTLAVLLGLVLNAAFDAWWADPLAGFVIGYYGLREAHSILHSPN